MRKTQLFRFIARNYLFADGRDVEYPSIRAQNQKHHVFHSFEDKVCPFMFLCRICNCTDASVLGVGNRGLSPSTAETSLPDGLGKTAVLLIFIYVEDLKGS